MGRTGRGACRRRRGGPGWRRRCRWHPRGQSGGSSRAGTPPARPRPAGFAPKCARDRSLGGGASAPPAPAPPAAGALRGTGGGGQEGVRRGFIGQV
eukprot:3147230-Pyramimonas_sp.AAC.1